MNKGMVKRVDLSNRVPPFPLSPIDGVPAKPIPGGFRIQ
jgi:hypothetical protein